MRRFAYNLIAIYTLLSAVVTFRVLLGFSFQLWLAMFLPLVGVAFALAHSTASLGGKKALLFLLLTLTISMVMESLGVTTGWIYGPYHYTDRLGPLFLGLVPFTIPLTWYMMLYPSYRIAERCVPAGWKTRRLAVAGLSALAMVGWDLAMDPLMASRAHWVWDIHGAYFGVPIQNFLGWWLTAFLILALYLKLESKFPLPPTPLDHGFDRLAVFCYALTGIGSAADAWLSGLYGPALIGGGAVLLWVVWGWQCTATSTGMAQEAS